MVCWGGGVQFREVIIYWGTIFYLTPLWDLLKVKALQIGSRQTEFKSCSGSKLILRRALASMFKSHMHSFGPVARLYLKDKSTLCNNTQKIHQIHNNKKKSRRSLWFVAFPCLAYTVAYPSEEGGREPQFGKV